MTTLSLEEISLKSLKKLKIISGCEPKYLKKLYDDISSRPSVSGLFFEKSIFLENSNSSSKIRQYLAIPPFFVSSVEIRITLGSESIIDNAFLYIYAWVTTCNCPRPYIFCYNRAGTNHTALPYRNPWPYKTISCNPNLVFDFNWVMY